MAPELSPQAQVALQEQPLEVQRQQDVPERPGAIAPPSRPLP
jgi:hypothetical protein